MTLRFSFFAQAAGYVHSDLSLSASTLARLQGPWSGPGFVSHVHPEKSLLCGSGTGSNVK